MRQRDGGDEGHPVFSSSNIRAPLSSPTAPPRASFLSPLARGEDTLAKDNSMIPGEIFPQDGDIELNAGAATVTIMVANTGDRPIQVGSHYHFFETNEALSFDRDEAKGMRLDIAAGTAVRFEPGQRREVTLVPLGGLRRVYGFQQKIMGAL